MDSAAIFQTDHEDGYLALVGRSPGRQWYQFDVAKKDAEAGRASKFVMTIWNFHKDPDDPSKLKQAIRRDPETGTYWYRFSRFKLRGATEPHRTALWTSIQIAVRDHLPMSGLLKDAKTMRCSLDHVFQIGVVVYEPAEIAWLMLIPPTQDAIGCEVREEAVPFAKHFIEIDQSVVMDLEYRISQSAKDERDARLARLKVAPRKPRRVLMTTLGFARNPDVVVEVLYRANGRCEGCFSHAPFNRKKNGEPYLEVHHRIPLSNDGDDTVENSIALCPNCHRERHYGV